MYFHIHTYSVGRSIYRYIRQRENLQDCVSSIRLIQYITRYILYILHVRCLQNFLDLFHWRYLKNSLFFIHTKSPHSHLFSIISSVHPSLYGSRKKLHVIGGFLKRNYQSHRRLFVGFFQVQVPALGFLTSVIGYRTYWNVVIILYRYRYGVVSNFIDVIQTK